MKKWKPSLCAAWTHLLDTIYVVDERTGEMLFLQDDAVMLWDCVEQGMDTEAITAKMARFGHEEEDSASILESLANLKALGMVEEVELC